MSSDFVKFCASVFKSFLRGLWLSLKVINSVNGSLFVYFLLTFVTRIRND